MFNADGVTITGNDISNADDAVSGRRGMNLDGNSVVEVVANTIDMGASGLLGPPFPVFSASPWAIQVAMSDAPAVDYSIVNNSLSGSYDGITVLSQRDVNGLRIVGNDIAAGFGVRVNTGSYLGTPLTYSNLEVSGNRIDATAFDATGWISYGVRLQDNFPATYRDARVTGNKSVGTTEAVVVGENATLENVLVRGNR